MIALPDEKTLMEYLPPVLRNVLEFRYLMAAVQKAYDAFRLKVQEVFENQFYDDAELPGIQRYERILGITPKATDTLEDRRFRIKLRFNEQLPFTYRALERKMFALCGADGYELTLIPEEFKLIVRVALTRREAFNDVREMLKRIVPANMLIDLSLLYNSHDLLSAMTHDEMHAYTHEQLREEVLDLGQ